MHTRHSDNQDPANAPEKHLSSSQLRPINVSLAITAQAARTYDEPTRHAALWLANVAANSQRIQLCWQRRKLPDPLGCIGRITEADLSAKLGLAPVEIYRALTGSPDADLPRFRAAVEKFRAEFEAALPPLVKTADTATIAMAFDMATDDHSITELRGKWRHGKTEEVERRWLLNLHHAVFVDVPESSDERTFLAAIAQALGIGLGMKKAPRFREQTRRAFGIGLIDLLILDEAHNLFPANLRDSKPIRLEIVRNLQLSLGVGSVLVTTEQFALSLELAVQHNSRWAPGQFLGRRTTFQLRETHTDAEIRAIAKLHAGRIDDAAVSGLIVFAKAEEGYLGAMVQAIKLARCAAGKGEAITAAHVARATEQQQRDQRTRALAARSVQRTRGKFTVVKEAA